MMQCALKLCNCLHPADVWAHCVSLTGGNDGSATNGGRRPYLGSFFFHRSKPVIRPAATKTIATTHISVDLSGFEFTSLSSSANVSCASVSVSSGSASPLVTSVGFVSVGSVSTDSVSTGAVSTGSVSTGTVSAGLISTGFVSTGSVFADPASDSILFD